MDHDRLLDEDILASFEKGEWRPVNHQQDEISRFSTIASRALTKDKRVNIRMSTRDIHAIQAKAAQEAVSYQTLMSSVLHKYVTGRLVERQTSE